METSDCMKNREPIIKISFSYAEFRTSVASRLRACYFLGVSVSDRNTQCERCAAGQYSSVLNLIWVKLEQN